jgi:hypothetical protein
MVIPDTKYTNPEPALIQPKAVSPAATGPAGPLLEGHVGAQYLLPLLLGGEARGLPGVTVTSVAFQRAGFNHPMDDVIVTGFDRQGGAATLELQAKRTITFTASDSIFASVVAQACLAAAKPQFATTRYELAVAIARTSTRIEQHIQDVLKWARDYQDYESFFRRLNQPGAAHKEMRGFVAAFRGHMHLAGAEHDDAAVWRLLSRFHVLAFDFEQPGSVCAQLARDRCALLLAPEEAGRAAELWDSLQQIALQVDAVGGDVDVSALRKWLTGERGYRLAGDRRLNRARERLAETSTYALRDIGLSVHGVTIDRSSRVVEALSALEGGRYLEIRGPGGVGKSGVLKDLALRVQLESCVLVLAPNRVPSGGWAALQAQLGCDANARELLTDLAGDGGGMLFVDGLDRFDDPGQRITVADLINAAAQVQGFRVVVTARQDFDADARAWLPIQAIEDLGVASPLLIDELSDDEMTQLRDADSALAALLSSGHPAEKLVRNLYRLNRLARSVSGEGEAPLSEAQMAWQWWETGDSEKGAGRLERQRLLRSLAVHSLRSSAPLDTSSLSTEAISALVASGSLRMLGPVRVEPSHDVLRDWAIGCLLYQEPEQLAALTLESPAPLRLVRGVELVARLNAEIGTDVEAWRNLLVRVSVSGAHGSWKRAVLLALARSERADLALTRCLPALAADNAALLADLVRAVVTLDSQPAAPFWAAAGVDIGSFNDSFLMPRGTTWRNLIFWSLTIGTRLPLAVVPQFADLYNRWCCAYIGQDQLSPILVGHLYRWLVDVERKKYPEILEVTAPTAAQDPSRLSMTRAQERDLRTAFLLWCKLRPADATSYLQRVANHPRRDTVFRHLLRILGSAPYAAPQAVADLFLKVLVEGDEDDEHGPWWQEPEVFMDWDREYFPASPARAPFLDLLQANKDQGLRLVRGVVSHAIRRSSGDREPGDNGIKVPFPCGERFFPWYESYRWSRSEGSSIVASALMALEAWAHMRIEREEAVESVIEDVLGPDGSPAAYLLVAVDVMLSHFPKARGCLWPFAASAELLAEDFRRFEYDTANEGTNDDNSARPEPVSVAKLENLRQRPSRQAPLTAVLREYGLHGPTEVREAMRQALSGDVARLGQPDSESASMGSPGFAAMSALNRLEAANYVLVSAEEGGQPFREYRAPAQEARMVDEHYRRVKSDGAEFTMRMHFMEALTVTRCSDELLEQGVLWANRKESLLQTDSDKDEQEWIERTRCMVAALIMRDGSRELKITYSEWARKQLAEAAAREPTNFRLNKHLPYNAFAIAAMGYLAEYRDDPRSSDLPRLLMLAAGSHTNMVAVLRAEVKAQRSLRPEIIRSLLRLGFVSAIYAMRQRGDDGSYNVENYHTRQEALEAARKSAEQTKLQDAIDGELRWLMGAGLEPGWPELPDPNPPKKRFGLSLRRSASLFGDDPALQHKRSAAKPRNFALNAKLAAQWLSLAVELWQVAHPDLLRTLVRHCWAWTAAANGVGISADEEPGELASEWNEAYFTAAFMAATPTGERGIQQDVLGPLAQLPEERFLDGAATVLHTLDQAWLARNQVSDHEAVWIRETLGRHLTSTSAWRRLAADRSARVEIHLAEAVAAMFLGRYERGQGPRCYIVPAGATRAGLLLPLLTELTEEAAGSTFVAVAFIELLEVEPQANLMTFLSRAARAWWQRQGPDAEFWIEYGVGQRLCNWIEKAVLSTPVLPTVIDGAELAATVDILVQCGTPSARRLEERIAAR